MDSNRDIEESEKLDVSRVFSTLIKHWWLFVVIVPMFIGLAAYKVHFSQSEYELETQLLLRNSDNKSVGSENLIEGMQIFSAYSNINNELGILKSFRLHLRTIKKLDFEPVVFSLGQVKARERYSDSPFKISLDKTVPQLIDKNFFITPIDDYRYKLKITAEDGFKLYDYIIDEFISCKDSSLNYEEEFYYNQLVQAPFFSFKVQSIAENFSLFDDETFSFKLKDHTSLANNYRGAIKSRALNKDASIIVINLSASDKAKGIKYLNALNQEYLRLGLEEKNKVAENTLGFINEQLTQISDSLSFAEKQLQDFRATSKVMDLDFTSIKVFENLEKHQKEKAELLTKDKYYKYLLDYITTTAQLDTLVAPSLMGISDQLLNNLLADLSIQYKERAGLNFNSGFKNPALQRLNAQIEKTKRTLIENVNGLISASEIRLNELKKSEKLTLDRVNQLPENERNLINIERKFNLNDQLYKYLLQKRAEASIALASNVADHKVLDDAQVITKSFTAGSSSYVIFGILGFIVCTLILFLKEKVLGRISGENFVRKRLKVPYLGGVGVNKSKSELPLKMYPNSPISESFRVVKSNLDHSIKSLGVKFFGVTSVNAREGKSFVAANLAYAYALAGKKTLLISSDLRKPDIHRTFGLSNTSGISTFVSGKSEKSEILRKTTSENLHLITSGPRSIYPTEDLGHKKFADLINMFSSEYDLIFFDTPPLSVVSDYFIISELIEVNLFVARDEFTKTAAIKSLNELHLTGRLKNCHLILNQLKEATVQDQATINQYYEYSNKKSYKELIKKKLKLSL